jgi:hypothetical protein
VTTRCVRRKNPLHAMSTERKNHYAKSTKPPGGTFHLADDLILTRVGYGAMQLAGPHVFGINQEAAANTYQILVARAFDQSHYRQRIAIKLASLAQAVGALITPEGFPHLSAEHTICLAAIVSLPSQSLLRRDND